MGQALPRRRSGRSGRSQLATGEVWHQMLPEIVAQVERMRRERWTGLRIAVATGLSTATVSRILTRLKLNKVSMIEPKPPPMRYEHAITRTRRTTRRILPWTHRYNWHRPHTSLEHKPPIRRSGLNVRSLLIHHRSHSADRWWRPTHQPASTAHGGPPAGSEDSVRNRS